MTAMESLEDKEGFNDVVRHFKKAKKKGVEKQPFQFHRYRNEKGTWV